MDEILPWKQALGYTLDRALATYDWLEAVQKEYLDNLSARRSASHSTMKMRILSDVFSVYLTTLVSGGKNRTLSLTHILPQEVWVLKLQELEIVKACKENRHNRSAHEADTYGHFVTAEEILSSDIVSVLNEVKYRLLVS